jgi:hypothetical protein
VFRIKRRIGVAAAALLGIAALGLTAGPAFAGGTPGPSPSVSPNFGVPPPVVRSCERDIRGVSPHATSTDTIGLTARITHAGNPTPEPTQFGNPRDRVRCRPEHFNIALVLAGNNLQNVITNYAAATGPVSGTGTDDSVSDTLDRLNLPSPADRVNLRHTGIPFPLVNLTNCTVAVLQNGNWTFNGGRGINRFAIGNGTFHLALLAHFPSIRGTCVLSFLRGNPLLQNRVSPDFLWVAVHGDGLAAR